MKEKKSRIFVSCGQ